MEIFDSIEEAPPDPIFGLTAEYKKDPRPNKFTFITGYYQDETLKIPLLDTIAEVELRLAGEKQNRPYLPIDGDQEFLFEIEKLVFGENIDRERIASVQTVGGTGALYLIGRLAGEWADRIAISDPTWANHWGIFNLAGLKTDPYPYYIQGKLPIEKTLKKLESLPRYSCVLLHTNCHNPTGLDFNQEQWKAILEISKKNTLFPILDMAYQGFSDTPEKDAFAPRLFLEKGIPFALTYTCAKNFSIYGERAGALFVIGESSKKTKAVQSQLKILIRGSYSNPPTHPAVIVKEVLKHSDSKQKWLKELEKARERMQAIRKAFVNLLIQKDPKGEWETIRNGKGLFCYSGLSKGAVKRLRDEKALYLAQDGRINLTGLNQENLEPFVDALLELK